MACRTGPGRPAVDVTRGGLVASEEEANAIPELDPPPAGGAIDGARVMTQETKLLLLIGFIFIMIVLVVVMICRCRKDSRGGCPSDEGNCPSS